MMKPTQRTIDRHRAGAAALAKEYAEIIDVKRIVVGQQFAIALGLIAEADALPEEEFNIVVRRVKLSDYINALQAYGNEDAD